MSRNAQKGFTLIEVLVSMAIFLTVMTGITLLFSGAVRSYRQQIKAKEMFEIATGTTQAIERDLERAFTAREHGNFYQFFGIDHAFTFVGVTDDGSLGRITYALNRLDFNETEPSTTFDTQYVDRVDLLMQRAIVQWAEISGDLAQSVNFARWWLNVLYAQGSLDLFINSQSDFDLLAAELDDAIATGLARYAAEGAAANAGDYDDIVAFQLGNMPNYGDSTVEADVVVTTGYLLRYEEPGLTDLDSLLLPYDSSGRRIEWPVIDTSVPETWDGALANCSGMYAPSQVESIGSQSTAGAFDAPLYCALYSAIYPPSLLDLRNAIYEPDVFTEVAPNPDIRYLNKFVLDELINARRREIWLRLLSDDPYLFQPQRFGNIIDTIGDAGDFWQSDPTLDPEDYIIAENIVVKINPVLDPANQDGSIYAQNFNLIDVINTPPLFNYGDADNNFYQTFNAGENITGYADYLSDPDAAAALDIALELDFHVATEYRGKTGTYGSPLNPRIPDLIAIQFWIMDSASVIGGPDFKHFFSQVVQVPSAVGRKQPANYVANHGR